MSAGVTPLVPRGAATSATRAGWFAERIASGAILAPMAGFSDAPFRRLARHFGAAWAVSEMVSAKGLASGAQDRRGLQISAPYQGEPFVVVQLFAAEPAVAARAVERLTVRYRPDAFDLNMGCPVKKVLNRGCGSELLRDPDRAAAIVAAMRGASDVPVSAKLRLGIDADVALEVAQAVAAGGASLIALHGRTAHQRYDGRADWDAIERVAAGVDVPLVGSGDVRDAPTYARARARGLGVMIARGAIGRPWLFAELVGAAPPTRLEVVTVLWRHARDHDAWYGGTAPLRSLRSQLAAYGAALAGAPGPAIDTERLRRALTAVSTVSELRVALLGITGIEPSRAHLSLAPAWRALAGAPLTVPRSAASVH